MFSDKEYVLLCGGGLGVAFLYLILRLSLSLGDYTGSDLAWAMGSLTWLQIIPILLYIALLIIHMRMLEAARKFWHKSVEGEFKKSFHLLNLSEVISVMCVFWILTMCADIPALLTCWTTQPMTALKFSFFPYWFVDVIMNGNHEKWYYAILWFFPFTVFSVIFELITYSKYYKARRRYTYLYPSVPCSDFYNAFISLRKKSAIKQKLIIPKDSLEEIEVPSCETITRKDNNYLKDPSSPLAKNLGNNSLYVVDSKLLEKRKNVFKTQAEIDAEEGGFFSGEEVTDTMLSFLPKRKKNIDQKSQEYERIQGQNSDLYGSVTKPEPTVNTNVSVDKPLDSEIPLDFDYQSFYKAKAPEEKKEEPEVKEDNKNLVPCPFCGTLNVGNRDECIFCGAVLLEDKEEKKNDKKLVPCPFCGTLNVDERSECIFCGADLGAEY